jgi:hypothetical protein
LDDPSRPLIDASLLAMLEPHGFELTLLGSEMWVWRAPVGKGEAFYLWRKPANYLGGLNKPDWRLDFIDDADSIHGISYEGLLLEEALQKIADFYERAAGLKQAFGLWSDRKVDGLEYERKLRDEWPSELPVIKNPKLDQ